MNSVTSLFVNQSKSIEELASTVSSFLNATFTKQNSCDRTLYLAYLNEGRTAIEILNNHGLVDDLGIPFSKYEYHIRIESNLRILEESIAKSQRHEIGWALIDQLLSLHAESIMVEGLQQLVERKK